MAKIFGLDLEAHGLGIRLELETLARAFIQKFSPGGVNLTEGSQTGEVRRAESGVGFLGRGQQAPSLPARGSEERSFCISGTHKCQMMHFPCIQYNP